MESQVSLPKNPVRFLMLARRASEIPSAEKHRREVAHNLATIEIAYAALIAILLPIAAAVDGGFTADGAVPLLGALALLVVLSRPMVWVFTCVCAAENDAGQDKPMNVTAWMLAHGAHESDGGEFPHGTSTNCGGNH